MEQIVVEEVRRLQAELVQVRAQRDAARTKLGTLLTVLRTPRGGDVLAEAIEDAQEALAA